MLPGLLSLAYQMSASNKNWKELDQSFQEMKVLYHADNEDFWLNLGTFVYNFNNFHNVILL
jgi:hypothetical protein